MDMCGVLQLLSVFTQEEYRTVPAPTSQPFRNLCVKEKSPTEDRIPKLQPLNPRLNYYKRSSVIIGSNEYGYWIKQAEIKSKFWC